MRMARIFSFVGFIVLLLGCGDGMGQVTGTVTFNGTPIEKGSISFYPVDGKAVTTGGKIKDGAYSVRVPIGEMQVKISMGKITGHKKLYDGPNSPVQPLTEEALPAKYNQDTELRLDVTPGKVEKNFELSGE